MVVGDDIQGIRGFLEDNAGADAGRFLEFGAVVSVAVEAVKIPLGLLHLNIGDGDNARQSGFSNIRNVGDMMDTAAGRAGVVSRARPYSAKQRGAQHQAYGPLANVMFSGVRFFHNGMLLFLCTAVAADCNFYIYYSTFQRFETMLQESTYILHGLDTETAGKIKIRFVLPTGI